MASVDALVTQSLECCLCYELFTQPKLLACAHTFCKECLVNLYECHPRQNQISCPICRHITVINNGDISKLQTNILIHSMVEDIKSAERSCTIHAICDPEAKSPASQYCAQCEEYMCDPCAVAHGKFKKVNHDVVSMDDVKKGKVKVNRYCTKHPEEEKLYVCTSCNVSICFRCRMLDHSKPDHDIKEVSDYKKTIQEKIKSIQTKAETRIAKIEAHEELVKEQKTVVEVELSQNIAQINQSYEEAVKHLTRQRNDLIDRCKQEKASHIARLEKIKESDDIEMCCIRNASDLVGKGIKALLEGQTLAVHNTICCDLEKMLDECNIDATQPRSIADRAKQLQFIKSSTPYILGDLRIPDWQLEKVSTCPLSHESPHDAVTLPDGRVAVAYWVGEAIEMFTVDGPQETVLKGVKVHCLSVLSDGRYVVRDLDNNITLYTQALEKFNVQFKTLSFSRFLGGMCVDGYDNIYVGCSDTGKIVVFRPEGGPPLREIPCDGYKPWEIDHTNHSRRLVVCDWSTKSVRVIDDMDEEGIVFHDIQMDSSDTRIAVLNDDSILIACREDGLLSIEHYTKDLKRIRTVLRDFPLADSICKLDELSTGEIVVVSEEQFIVFHKI